MLISSSSIGIRLVFLPLVAISVLAGCGSAPEQQAIHTESATGTEYLVNGKVVLGSTRLLSGIPGEGALKTSEVKVWLANSENHKPLEFILPAHLRSATEQIYVPEDNPLTRAKIELGRQLFFDHRLGTMSCADCHQPRQAFSAHQVFPDTGLSPLVSFNRILGRQQFWNGKATSLEDVPQFPVRNVFEMATTPKKLVEVVRNIEGYRLQFESIFGEVTFEGVCKAMACFQRALVTGPSAYDLHQLFSLESDLSKKSLSEKKELQRLKGFVKLRPISTSALRGKELFHSDRIGCVNCHSGSNFTDEDYHNLGVGWSRPDPGLGRFLVTKRLKDKGAIKTPTLRNVAKTPPYMHDGSIDTLEAVVEFFNRGGSPNPHLSEMVKPLSLSQQEKVDLVEFLRSLTSPLPAVETGRLPK